MTMHAHFRDGLSSVG